MIWLMASVLVYLLIGVALAEHDKLNSRLSRGEFSIETVFYWIFAIDIRIKSWLEIRRIKRGGA